MGYLPRLHVRMTLNHESSENYDQDGVLQGGLIYVHISAYLSI